MTEQEGIDELKRVIPQGSAFGFLSIQRHLKWGFNRAYRTMLLAVETGQARYTDDTERRIVWVKVVQPSPLTCPVCGIVDQEPFGADGHRYGADCPDGERNGQL